MKNCSWLMLFLCGLCLLSGCASGNSQTPPIATGVTTHFSVTAVANAAAGTAFNVTVTALDSSNNVVITYSGMVRFTSSDPQAAFQSASSTLTNGTGSYSVTLKTAAVQTITATDSVNASITGSISINVTAPTAALTITSNSPPAGTVGSEYNPHKVTYCVWWNGRYCEQLKTVNVLGFPLAGRGGVPPYNWSWAAAAGSSLPAGLSVANPGSPSCPIAASTWPGTGPTHPACIFGMPMQPGTNNVVITMTDSGLPSAQATAKYTITINLPQPPVVNTTPPPPPGVVGRPYNYIFPASGYPPLTWSESGPLPNGLAFDDRTGVLSGIPTVANSFPITVTATDQLNQNSAEANFTIVVSAHGFQVTGSMTTARTLHTATLLTDGKVLVVGGQFDPADLLATAELFDPSTGNFTATEGMQISRSAHTATLLTTGLNAGKVLVTGGQTSSAGNATATAELYDPTGATSTATGSMQTARYGHTATILSNGNVLVIGGADATGTALASAEIFDPTKGTFTATGSMQSARRGHTATLLANGNVLVTGGIDANSTHLASAELFDPNKGTFTTAVGVMTVTRVSHTATLLNGTPGKVLLAGGVDDSGNTRNTVELFDPTDASFSATTNMITAHSGHTATLLTDGTVLLAGGVDGSGNPLVATELFNPGAGAFASTGDLVTPRERHTATLLNDGRVLATGGFDTAALKSAELYQ
jgi:hypothetical protein